MDLRVSSSPLTSTMRTGLLPKTAGTQAAPAQDTGFTGALKSALGSVSELQNQAGKMQEEVQKENPSVSLEDTMVAIQKAQIGFQATMHVRNRMVQAYTDIMNMQV